MRTRVWTVAVLAPALLLLSGCAEMNEHQRQAEETQRVLAQQPFFNGYNAGWLSFVASVTVVLVVLAIAGATAHVLVERRRSRERVEIARLQAAQRSEGSYS